MSNKDTGFLGENIAVDYLTQNGFEILQRNWRYKHLEIDIIASKQGILHIIEVKTRSNIQHGYPEQAITSKKMQFLKNAAAHYQYEYAQWKYLQFDVAAIYLNDLKQWDLFFIEDVYF
ncbi:MAG: YraN family protein [Sediminibacterium sp.]|jgi:putative endonuclease